MVFYSGSFTNHTKINWTPTAFGKKSWCKLIEVRYYEVGPGVGKVGGVSNKNGN